MSDSTEIVDMEISERAQICVAKLQEVIAEFDLSGADAAMSAGELFAWVHILAFMPHGKDRMLAQMDRSAVSARHWAEDHFEGFKARAAVVAAFDRGESGGRMQ